MAFRCFMNIQFNRYSQARMLVNLSIADMASLLETDPSNLSKYEKGKLVPSLPMVVAYHIVSQIPLEKLLDQYITKYKVELSAKLKTLIDHLEDVPKSTRVQKRLNAYGAILERLSQSISLNSKPDDHE